MDGFSNQAKDTGMEEKMQWFVVNVHTGCEDKVARGLREQIDKRRLNALFGEIMVPTREVFSGVYRCSDGYEQ